VAVVADQATTSSTLASSTPSRIVALDCLRNPPELCSHVARYSWEQGVDQDAGVLVVDDGDDELHGAEYRRTAGRCATPSCSP
jgi:hypothetical protein